MGVHRILCGVAAAMLLAACGDPAAVSDGDTGATGATDKVVDTTTVTTPPDSVAAVPLNGLRICSTDTPFNGTPDSPQPSEALNIATTSWLGAHPDLVAGMWWDGGAAEFVVMAVDVDATSALIEEELPPDLAYRVEPVPRSTAQLTLLQQRAETLSDHGVEATSWQRVWDATLEIDLAILDAPTLDAVRQVFPDDLDAICITGADPATVPPDGPQPTAGEGWRLLADEIDRGTEAYSVNAAVNNAEYESLWGSLALETPRPPVDLTTEIVLYFGAVYSGSCPEIRLDDVVFDLERSLVTADVVQLGGNRECTADANRRAYLVAVDRAALPPLPFVISLQADCPYCQQQEITTLEGTESPAATLSESDRMQILAAAAVWRLEYHGPMAAAVDVIEVVGQATSDGGVRFEGGVSLTEAERSTIVQALGARTVRFIPVPDFEDFGAATGYTIISLAEPAVVGGRLTITTALWCGNLCGNGGTFALERHDDGSWSISDAVGPQWEA